MALCYTKLRFGQYVAGGHTFADIDPEQLRLIKGKRRDAYIQEGDPRSAM